MKKSVKKSLEKSNNIKKARKRSQATIFAEKKHKRQH